MQLQSLRSRGLLHQPATSVHLSSFLVPVHVSGLMWSTLPLPLLVSAHLAHD